MRTLGLVHATQDASYAQELRRQLRNDLLWPLRLRLLDETADPCAASVLLVLESPDLTEDQQRRLEQARSRGALLLPVPLRPMVSLPVLRGLQRAVGSEGYSILLDPRPGERTALRDDAWVKVVEGLRRSLEHHRPAPSAPAPTRHSSVDHRRPLYLELTRHGDALRLRYLRHTPRGLEQIHQVDRPWPAALPRLSDGPTYGEALFRLLFPDEAWRPVLQALFQLRTSGAANPTYQPVALRVVCTEASLGSLWLPALRFSLCPLREHGWTFEWATQPAGTLPAVSPRELLLPARALVVGAPDGDAMAPIIEALRHVVRHRRDGAPETEALRVLPAGQPARAVLHGDSDRACEVLLVLGAAPGLSELLADLQRPPLLAYVDGPLPAADLAALRRDVPVVLAGPGQLELLLRWLRRLPLGPDPVAALYAAARAAERDGQPCWGGLPTAYSLRALPVSAPRRPRLEGSPWLKLDRQAQRSMALYHISDGLLRGTRQVEALVVYGEKGNHVESFREQLRSELPGDLHTLAPVQMTFPDPREGTSADPRDVAPLLQRLRSQAAVDLAGSSEVALHKALQDLMQMGPRPQLLILDYQVHDLDGTGLRGAHLVDWLRLCQELSLPGVCPDGLRVLCYLALQLPEDKHKKLSDFLGQQTNLLTPRFRHSRLPPLGGIAHEDLLNFLMDKSHCDCPEGQEHEFMDLIMKVTSGNYEATVARLRRAMDEVGWARLKRELRDDLAGLVPSPEDL